MGITERLEEQEIEAALQREIPDEPEMLGTYPKGWCKKLGCPVVAHRAEPRNGREAVWAGQWDDAAARVRAEYGI